MHLEGGGREIKRLWWKSLLFSTFVVLGTLSGLNKYLLNKLKNIV